VCFPRILTGQKEVPFAKNLRRPTPQVEPLRRAYAGL
jgi:hypothetical protein